MQYPISGKHNQQGMTIYAAMFFLGVIGFAATLAIKLGPVYMENNVVKDAMKSIHDDYAGTNMQDVQDTVIKGKVQRYFQVNMVSSVIEQSMKITRNKDKVILSFNYEIRKPFMYNVDTVVVFTNEVDLAN
jgi:hypothetical protein